MKKIVHLAILFAVFFALENRSVCAKNRTGTAPETAKFAPEMPVLRPVKAVYDVYVGGFLFLTAKFNFEANDGKYSISTKAWTNGILGSFVPWGAELRSEGAIYGVKFKPKIYKNSSTWRDETKTTFLRFDENDNVDVEFVPYEQPSEKRNVITAEQKSGALDPLSGVLQLLGNLAIKGKCAGVEPVFDGRRRFDLIAEDKGRRFNNPYEYGIYKGDARYCEVGFKTVAGEWKDRERSRFWQYVDGTQGGREPFEIWLAKLAPDLPEMAVRAESPTVWGRIVVHLKEWKYTSP